MEVILLFAGCAVCVTLFAPEIMRILGPEEYYGGIYVIPSVVAGVFFTAVFTLYMRIELYLKKTSTIMVATVLSAVANLALNYVFIPKVGYTAAGYTTLVCYILLEAFHAINLNRLGYGDVYNNKQIWSVAGVVCGVIVSVSLVYPYTILRYCLIGIMLVILFCKRKQIMSIISKKNRKAQK